MKLFTTIILALTIAGCASAPTRDVVIVDVGMTIKEVRKHNGQPTRVRTGITCNTPAIPGLPKVHHPCRQTVSYGSNHIDLVDGVVTGYRSL